MTREEEIKQAPIDYFGPVNAYNPLPWVSFREGAKWADSHPRKGLVDIEKVCEWLIENMHDYFNGDSEFAVTNDFITCDEFIENFKKAMEE